MDVTNIKDFTKYPLRALKIFRKNYRSQRSNPFFRELLKQVNTAIKIRQDMPRMVFQPNYISRTNHRRMKAS